MAWRKGTLIFIDVIGWFLFLALPVFFIEAQSPDKDVLSIISSWQFLFFLSVYLFLYCFNVVVLLPHLYFRKRIFLYIFSVVSIVIILWLIHPFDNLVRVRGEEPGRRPPPGEFRMENDHGPEQFRDKGPRSSPHVDIVSIFLGVAVLAMGFAIKTAEAWQNTKQKLSEAETDKLNAELSFLKAQINPHFLFNTLNNLYILAKTKNEKTAEGIMGLSNIMRYITDDAIADYVPLEKEINCMKDFIELQKLRITDKTKIDFCVSGDIGQKKIAPLLFMTFIENCFKYGTSNHENSEINIQIKSLSDSIVLYCQNKIFNRLSVADRNAIGITNAQKRLEHLYPDKHELLISEANGLFTVELTIKD